MVKQAESQDAVSRVSGSVNVYDVRFVRQYTHLNEVVDGDSVPTCRRESRSHEVERDNKKNVISVQAIFSFELAHNTEESKKDPPIVIHAVILLQYEVKDLVNFTDEEIDAFAHANGCYNAWPFWREYVYSSMSRMGLPPITLGTFYPTEERVSEPQKEESND